MALVTCHFDFNKIDNKIIAIFLNLDAGRCRSPKKSRRRKEEDERRQAEERNDIVVQDIQKGLLEKPH